MQGMGGSSSAKAASPGRTGILRLGSAQGQSPRRLTTPRITDEGEERFEVGVGKNIEGLCCALNSLNRSCIHITGEFQTPTPTPALASTLIPPFLSASWGDLRWSMPRRLRSDSVWRSS